MQSKKALIWSLSILSLLIFSWIGLWFWGSHYVRAEAEQWMKLKRDEGWTLSYEKIAVRGFPFSLRLQIDRPQLRSTPGFYGIDWQGEEASLEAKVWSPKTLALHVKGESGLKIFNPQEHSLYHLTFSGIKGQVQQGKNDRVLKAVLNLENSTLIAGEKSLAQAKDVHLTIENFVNGGMPQLLSARPDASSLLETPLSHVNGKVEGLSLTDMEKFPLGSTVETLSLSATLLGDPSKWLESKDLSQRFVTWHQAGGTLEVKDLALKWGPLDLTTSGTFAFDQNLQPIAAFTFASEDFKKALDVLHEQKAIEVREEKVVRMALDLLQMVSSKKSENGQISLSLQDQALFIGPVKISSFNKIQW